MTGQGLETIEQFTAYIIRIHVAKRWVPFWCHQKGGKLWVAKLFADGKAVSEYTNHDNENCIRKINFKGKVQERSIKDYVRRLLKCWPEFFSRNSEGCLNTILSDRCFLTLTAKKTPARPTEEILLLHSSLTPPTLNLHVWWLAPPACVSGGHISCPVMRAELTRAGAVVAGWVLQHWHVGAALGRWGRGNMWYPLWSGQLRSLHKGIFSFPAVELCCPVALSWDPDGAKVDTILCSQSYLKTERYSLSLHFL